MIRVLHVLPHAGAGADTYIRVLSSLEDFTFDVFELSESRTGLAALASIAGRQPGLAKAARCADLIHVHGEVASSISLPWLLARRSVVTLHGLHLARRLPRGLPRRLGQINLRLIVGAANRTICVSNAERDELRWLPERLQAKLAVVLNGLELPHTADQLTRQRVRTQLGLSEDAVAVLYAGQLERRKDPFTLIRAAQRAREHDQRITLLIAGDGPAADAVRSLVADGMLMLGQRTDIPALMEAADIFVMPSLREGLSYAVLESMGQGLPTVVSDAPGNPEAVGEAGIVFRAGDDHSLASVLVELASDARARAARGAAGRERVMTEMSADRMRHETLHVYQQVLKAPAHASDERGVSTE
jgi:glycosyltransferase involved in cell wall biosynthesis